MRFYLDSEFMEDGETIIPLSIALVTEDNHCLYLENDEADHSAANDFVSSHVLPNLGLDVAERIAETWYLDDGELGPAQAHHRARRIGRTVSPGIGAPRVYESGAVSIDDQGILMTSGGCESTAKVSSLTLNLTAKSLPHAAMGTAVLSFVTDATNREFRDEEHAVSSLEFWADYGAYDWVMLCQLFGRMIDLPAGWPMFHMELRQALNARSVDVKDLGDAGLEYLEHATPWQRCWRTPPLPAGPEHHALRDALVCKYIHQQLRYYWP